MNQVQILDIHLEPIDQQRIRCIVELSDFEQHPDILIELWEINGALLSSITIIETPDTRNVYVLHVQKPVMIEQIEARSYVIYPEFGIIHQMTKSFSQ